MLVNMSFYNMYGWNKTLMIPHQGNSLVTASYSSDWSMHKKIKQGKIEMQNRILGMYNTIKLLYTLYSPLYDQDGQLHRIIAVV